MAILNRSSAILLLCCDSTHFLHCKPIPPKFWGWQIHPLNLGGGVSEILCFTVVFGGAPPKFRGEMSLSKGYGFAGCFLLWNFWRFQACDSGNRAIRDSRLCVAKPGPMALRIFSGYFRTFALQGKSDLASKKFGDVNFMFVLKGILEGLPK